MVVGTLGGPCVHCVWMLIVPLHWLVHSYEYELFILTWRLTFTLLHIAVLCEEKKFILVDLYGILLHWGEGETNRIKHDVVAVLGRF